MDELGGGCRKVPPLRGGEGPGEGSARPGSDGPNPPAPFPRREGGVLGPYSPNLGMRPPAPTHGLYLSTTDGQVLCYGPA